MVRPGDQVRVSGGKYDGKTGEVASVADVTCMVLIDGVKTGNIKLSHVTAMSPSTERATRGGREPPMSPVRQPDFSSETPMDVEQAFATATDMMTGSIVEEGSKLGVQSHLKGKEVSSKLRAMMKECLDILNGTASNRFCQRKLSGHGGDDADFYPAADKSIKKDPKNKIVIFSFFTTVLDAVGVLLKSHSIPYFRIDGSVTDSKREQHIEAFKCLGSPRIFLVSVKAGGAGLNLQSANVAMLLDPWWNPAKLRQAQDRVWRIGSDHKEVFVYNWFTSGLDDKVLENCAKKEKLYQQTIRLVENQQPGRYELRDRNDLERELRDAGYQFGRGSEPRPHQKVGIRWMQIQEAGQNPKAPGVTGGIYADDMGLGKTMQMLSVIMLDVQKTGTTKPTLVAVPKSAFNSWQKDAVKFFGPSLDVYIWHEEKNRISAMAITQMAARGKPLLVLTNEAHLKSYAKTGMLLDVDWRRVVLDESQRINNKKYDFEAACALKADFKWSLSGTPIENELGDFDAHLKFIGASEMFDSPMMLQADKLQGVLMRRTKLGVQHHYAEELPACFVWVHKDAAVMDSSQGAFEMDAQEFLDLAAYLNGTKNVLARYVKGAIKSSDTSYDLPEGPSGMTRGEKQKLNAAVLNSGSQPGPSQFNDDESEEEEYEEEDKTDDDDDF